MTKLTTILLIAFAINANAANVCGGKKMGVAFCNNDGDFVCRDGSISTSKKLCVSQVNSNTEVVNYRAKHTAKKRVKYVN